jgi:plastocyanin
MTRLSLAVCLLVALALAGCGGSSSGTTATGTTPATSLPATSTNGGSSAGGGALSLAADPSGQLKFDKTSLTTAAGSVKITFTNGAPLAHNLTIASSSGQAVGSTPTFQGGSKTLTVTLKPGTYTFYCSVPGHRQGGMQGTLVVH